MEGAKSLVWGVIGLPLLGATILGLFGRRLPKALAGGLGTLAVLASFALGVVLTLALSNGEVKNAVVAGPDWIAVVGLRLPFEWVLDPLSLTMVLVITGIGALIHLYSTGYMSEERDYARFFAYLNLFVAAMLTLVLGNNLALLFVGWEGVGLCSYLLIGFWYRDLANVRAANKAFIVNRIGDWSLMIGLFLLAVLVMGSKGGEERALSYDVMLPALRDVLRENPGWATAIGLLLFGGAAGKSAQFPLYVWLPDAMAGPTPVSALIHAATMVTSGVVLLNRMQVVYDASPVASAVVCAVGAFTALFAALVAFGQTDIKKVLAYSTVSQLGFMFIGVGAGAYWTGMYHVVTHAFFKALLFLGAGAVIHAMAHHQDMRDYGALRKYLPITFLTMAIGWISIAAVVPAVGGFYSKEALLGAALARGQGEGGVVYTVAGWVGLFTALLTALYMTRLFSLTFLGKDERWRAIHAEHHDVSEEPGHHALDANHQPHEAPVSMTAPLIVLALLSLAGGFLMHQGGAFEKWLASGAAVYGPVTERPVEVPNLMLYSLVAAGLGLLLGIAFYRNGLPKDQGNDETLWSPVRASQRDQFGFDRMVTESAVVGGGDVALALGRYVDDGLIDGAVRGSGGLASRAGGVLRGLQTGFVRLYALMMLVGGVGVVGWFLFVLSRDAGGAR